MTERSFDEMIAYFNRRVADMDINQDCKMELLGMVTALGYKHEKSAQQWIPCSERLPEYGKEVLTVNKDGEYEINHVIDEEDSEWFFNGALAWMPLPEPWEGAEHETD